MVQEGQWKHRSRRLKEESKAELQRQSKDLRAKEMKSMGA